MLVISRMAEVPESKACQKLAVLLPRALTTPVPVMTTRRTLFSGRRICLRLDQMGDTFNHFVNVLDLLGFLVVDLDVELAFKVKKDVQAIQRIDPEGFKAAVGMHILYGHTFRGRNNLQNSIFDGQAGQCQEWSLYAINTDPRGCLVSPILS